MTTFNPEPRSHLHSTIVRYYIILCSSINSFFFVTVLLIGAMYHHLLDKISGREKDNRPKENNDIDSYKVREPYPNLKNLKITTELRYYAQLLDLDLEEYVITTKDGYVLTLHRLIHPNESIDERNRKTPILLQHGLLLCSGAWLTPGRNSLAFYFMEMGYDVWMGNNRCGFEPKHTELSGNLFHNEKFWDWDVRWLAYYDMPCIIDNVLLHKPLHSKLFLIGHLQGCTQSLLLLRNGELRETHKKIECFFALAPAAFPGSLFYERSFIKFMHNRSLVGFRLVFGSCCFLKILGVSRKLIGCTRIFKTLSYIMFKYLFGWSIKNSHYDPKVVHIQFLFNISYISSRLMSWWLSKDVEEGFLNQLQPKKAYEDGSNAAYTPAPSIAEKNRETTNSEPALRTVKTEVSNTVPAGPSDEAAHNENTDDSKTFFPYKEEWFTSTELGEIIPMVAFVGGEDYLVDGKRFLTHMRHYERHYFKEGGNLELYEIPEYNHLDVIWALNCIGQIGMPIDAKIKSITQNA